MKYKNTSAGFALSSFIAAVGTLALTTLFGTTTNTLQPTPVRIPDKQPMKIEINREIEIQKTTEMRQEDSAQKIINTQNRLIPPPLKNTDGEQASIETRREVVTPPEVKPLQDITAPIGTIRTKVDESKEIIKTIVDDHIENALSEKGVTPTPEKAAELQVIKENIIQEISSNVATTTPPTPVRTKEIKAKIDESLKKIDKITAEIKTKSTTTSETIQKPVTERRDEIEKNNLPPLRTGATSTDRIENGNTRPAIATGTPELFPGKIIEERKVVNPADAARQINKLIDGLAETVNTQSKEFKDQGGDLLFKDSNNDGISDYESIHLYNIDPIAPAPVSVQDGKTLTPEEKILRGYDPAKTELVKIDYQEPRESTYITPAYTVEDLKLTDTKAIEIRGKALPNSFVTVYIYSTPIIVTVKTDANGEWKYTLDKELEDGQHTVYTASVNNSGKILARSSPVLFVKTAEAATIEQTLVETPANAQPTLITGKDIFFFITAFLGIVLIAINLIGARKTTPTPPTV